jgi:hypothetical protein
MQLVTLSLESTMSSRNYLFVFVTCSFISGVDWIYANLALGQSPVLIASAALEKGTLELYATTNKPFGLDGRDRLYRFGEPPQFAALANSLKFGTWTKTRLRGDTDEYVLGFLYKNKDGQRPAAQVKMITAYRATLPDNSEATYWPTGNDSPFNEISNYEWKYQLAPLVIEVPKRTTSLAKLEGAIVSLPQDVTTVSLTKEGIRSKATSYGRQVVVISGGAKKDADGLTYDFFICRAPKKLKKGNESVKTSGRDKTPRGSDTNITFSGIASTGERVSPNGQFSVAIDDGTRRKVVSELKSKRGGKPAEDILEEAAYGVLADPGASFTAIKINFRREKVEFDGLEVSVRESTGDPVFQTFVLNDVPLGQASDVDTINDYVAKLPVETLELESPMKPRKWQDTTGKFNITAKVISVKDGKVVLQKEDGSIINVPIEKLSEPDRKYLESATNK